MVVTPKYLRSHISGIWGKWDVAWMILWGCHEIQRRRAEYQGRDLCGLTRGIQTLFILF
jgi:hypothetical protein